MSGWQRIESAPRDGSWIMACVDGSVVPIRWSDDQDDDFHSGWCGAGHEYGGVLYNLHYTLSGEPTHWMPFPAAPDAAA